MNLTPIWRPIGGDLNEGDDPRSRLLAEVGSLTVHGLHLHLEAIEVRTRADTGEDEAVNPSLREQLDALYSAHEPDGQFQRAEIDGREYVVYAYPYA